MPELMDNSRTAAHVAGNAESEGGLTARLLFPGGTEIEYTPEDFLQMVQKTKALTENGCTVIYNAAFIHPGIKVTADILLKKDQHWELYNVKNSASVRKHHVRETALQWSVISRYVPLKKASVVRINTSYVRKGSLDAEKLFVKQNVTEQVISLSEEIPTALRGMQDILSGDCPQAEIGGHCTVPFVCDFYKFCRKDIPEPSVFRIAGLSGEEKYGLYRKGIRTMQDIPDDYQLTELQKIQIRSTITGEKYVNTDIIKKYINKIKYPVSYLDFEACTEAVPRYDFQRPYQHVPFQYSLFTESEPGKLHHSEFLADEASDPRLQFTERLLHDLPQEGTIIAYNISFEKSIIRQMAQLYPQHRKHLENLLSRFEDLIEVFRGSGLYYPAFNGSLSVKSVLHALFPDQPELDYGRLGIRNGQMAMNQWKSLHTEKNPEKKKKIREDLLQYCRLDALALLKITAKLRELIR